MPPLLQLRQPWFVLAASLVLTLLATALAWNWVQARRVAAFAAAVESDLGTLVARFETHTALLRASAAMIETRGDALSRSGFATYVDHLDVPAHFPGVQGIGWSPRVDARNVAAFEAEARREGLEGFRVWPPGPREPMFSILYLEPLDERNHAALGFDMYSEPTRAEAMAHARDTGQPALSGRLTLKQEIDEHRQAGFLLYVPTYDPGPQPANVAERRARLSGFAYAPFRAVDLFSATLGRDDRLVAVRAYSGREVDARAMLYDSVDPADAAAPGAIEATRALTIGGQPWTLHFVPRARLLAGDDQLLTPAVAFAGLVVSGLLFVLSREQQRSRQEIAEGLARERAAHERTEQQKRTLDLLVEQSGEGIVMADAAGVLRVFNPAAERQHGVSRRVLPAAEWQQAYQLYTLERRPLPVDEMPLVRALRGEEVRDARWMVHRPDGRWRTLSGTATPLRDTAGEPVGAVLIVHDETERRQAEQERQRLLDALARSNAELDQFAYVTSHDLKAPLRGIANLATWIEEDLGPAITPEAVGHLKLLRGRVQRMEGLIEGILAYSRAGRTGAAREPVEVGALLREVIELLAPPPAARIECREPLPVVEADRTALQQVFLNLVGNALKHAGDAPAPRVVVACADDGDAWRFSVSDNGPGIAPEYRERVWELFQTLRSRDRVEGAGIGLSIVRKTVRAAGGRTWIEDADAADGGGARLVFTWPKTAAATDDDA